MGVVTTVAGRLRSSRYGTNEQHPHDVTALWGLQMFMERVSATSEKS